MVVELNRQRGLVLKQSSSAIARAEVCSLINNFSKVADRESRRQERGRWCADANRPTCSHPPGPSPTDAVRRGSAKFGHPVQEVAREDRLTPLPRCIACPKTVADD